jgi:hypothetical protein
MKGESTAVPGDRAWIDDLANEVALLVVVVKGEEHGLTGVPLFDQPSHVHVAFRDQLGVAEIVWPKGALCGGYPDPACC